MIHAQLPNQTHQQQVSRCTSEGSSILRSKSFFLFEFQFAIESLKEAKFQHLSPENRELSFVKLKSFRKVSKSLVSYPRERVCVEFSRTARNEMTRVEISKRRARKARASSSLRESGLKLLPSLTGEAPSSQKRIRRIVLFSFKLIG